MIQDKIKVIFCGEKTRIYIVFMPAKINKFTSVHQSIFFIF